MATAVSVDWLLSGARDSSGNALAGGYIWTYEQNSTTPKATYADNAKVTQLSNPLTLDSAGKALVFADGIYKFVVYDSSDTIIETRDGLVYSTGGNVGLNDGTLSAPSLYFLNDTDTGFYLIGTGRIGIVINGVLIGEWNSSGLLVWGTVQPQ